MSASLSENHKTTIENLISEFKESLAERLGRTQFSDIPNPFLDLVSQNSHPSSAIATYYPTTGKGSHKLPTTDSDHFLEKGPTIRDKSFMTITRGSKSNRLSDISCLYDPDSSTDLHLSPYMINLQPGGEKWRLKPQLCPKNATLASHTTRRRSPVASNPFVTVDGIMPTPRTTSITVNKGISLAASRITENDSCLSPKNNFRRHLLGVPKSDSPSRNEMDETKSNHFVRTKRNGQEPSSTRRFREFRLPETLSERQLNGKRALQRRLEYDPHASVERDKLRLKSTDNRRGQANSWDHKGQSKTDRKRVNSHSKRHSLGGTKSGYLQFLHRNDQNAKTVEPTIRDFTSSQSEAKPSTQRITSNKSNSTEAEVEKISQRLEGLATHVIHLRKLVERDYSETGYCSAGDDIYVDEEVGAVNNGKPTGMHPSIASSLRSIRLLEGNVQEIFDLLYLNEAQIWKPTELTKDLNS